MKLRLGGIPINEDFDPEEEGWTPMKEVSPVAAQFIALPIGFLVAWGLHEAWSSAGASVFRAILSAWIFAWMPIVIIAHELIHGLFHPGAGFSSKSTYGFWPAKLVAFAYYDGAMSRRQFLTSLIAPFVIISLGPLLVSPFLETISPMFAFISIFNALLSCVDILGVLFVAAMVPKSARMRNKGWQSYYQVSEPT